MHRTGVTDLEQLLQVHTQYCAEFPQISQVGETEAADIETDLVEDPGLIFETVLVVWYQRTISSL